MPNLANYTVERFNPEYPIGTRVRYWPGFREPGQGAIARTRTPAFIVGGTPCVSVTDYPGGIALTHVDLEPETP